MIFRLVIISSILSLNLEGGLAQRISINKGSYDSQGSDKHQKTNIQDESTGSERWLSNGESGDDWNVYYTNLLNRKRSSFVNNTDVTGPNSAADSCGKCCGYGPIRPGSFYKLNKWYKKVIKVDGLLITAHGASDSSLYEAALTVDRMAQKRPHLLAQLHTVNNVILAVLGKNEVTTDVPEYKQLGSDWDWTRGLGATDWIPVTSCAEENLLCFSNDSYRGENICIHETAHSLSGSAEKLSGTRYVDPGKKEKLIPVVERNYNSAMNKGKWFDDYASTNYDEYWAEGTQSYYNKNQDSSANTRAALKKYDLPLYKILDKVFPADMTFPCPPKACNCDKFVCPGKSNEDDDVNEDPPTRSPTKSPNKPPKGECTKHADCDDKNKCTRNLCRKKQKKCIFKKIKKCCLTKKECNDKDKCTKDRCNKKNRCTHKRIKNCSTCKATGEQCMIGTECCSKKCIWTTSYCK